MNKFNTELESAGKGINLIGFIYSNYTLALLFVNSAGLTELEMKSSVYLGLSHNRSKVNFLLCPYYMFKKQV